AGRTAVGVRRAAGAQPGRVVAAAGVPPGAGGPVHAAGDHLLGVLQLAAVAHQRAHQHPGRLGRILDGTDGVWAGLVGQLCGGRMGQRAHAHRLGLAAGRRPGLHRGGACGAGLPLLGGGRAARRACRRRVFHQPHALVCRGAVGGVSGRHAQGLSRRGVCADRGRH
ncbi:hypothetical protein KXW64_008551, partial [Aspergillus fumigatus]